MPSWVSSSVPDQEASARIATSAGLRSSGAHRAGHREDVADPHRRTRRRRGAADRAGTAADVRRCGPEKEHQPQQQAPQAEQHRRRAGAPQRTHHQPRGDEQQQDEVGQSASPSGVPHAAHATVPRHDRRGRARLVGSWSLALSSDSRPLTGAVLGCRGAARLAHSGPRGRRVVAFGESASARPLPS